ncbi:MAG TPA: ABC transporter permease [Gammaproteobacteria bacterium]|nr:ABC transporter permease [Gammaproteobacteria bacterium]
MINQLYPLCVLLHKEINRICRIWRQTFIPPIITTSMYFIIFGTVFSKKIGVIEGSRYIDFITPGLVMLSLVINSFSNVASSFFLERFYGGVNQLLCAPLSSFTILTGFVSGGIFRGLLSSLIVIAVAEWFTNIHIAHIGITLLSLFLTSTLFSLIGLTNAILAHTFDDLSVVPNFILTPLLYLGGVFYSIHQLPPLWKTLSLLNPILYIVNTLRFGLLGHANIDIQYSFAVIIITVISLTYINIWLLKNSRQLHP